MLFRTIFASSVVSVAVAYDNGAPNSKLPVLGWSSWVALAPADAHPIFDYCDEESVMHAVDAFVELGFPEAGYHHFHLDDCWAGSRNASGYLVPEEDHFPNGMKKVVDYAHSKGLDFGLYTCGGTFTCVGRRPGSKDHWTQDAAVWAEWGVDWVKMDWCNSQGEDIKTTYGLMSKALNASGRHIHFNMCEWGNENPWEWGDEVAQSWRMAGDHTGIWSSTKQQVANTAAIPAEYTGQPYGWNDMDMLETGNYDQAAHANNKESNMTAEEYMTEFSMWAISASPLTVTTPIMNCSYGDSESFQNGGLRFKPSRMKPGTDSCNVSLTKQHSVAPCTLGTSFGCNSTINAMWTRDGCRGEFSCDGHPTVCDVDGVGTHTCFCGPAPPVKCTPWISDLQKKILFNTEVIAINQDVTPQGRPIGHFDADSASVWARNLSDGSVAVAFYNPADDVADMSVKFTDLGLAADATVKVRDLWQHTDVGIAKSTFPSDGAHDKVPAHNTHLFRFTPQ